MLTSTVDLDVPEIERLTKADVIEFFKTFLSPSSLQRAKLSVHMVAQKTVAPETTSDSEKRDKLREALRPVLVSNDVAVDDEKLKPRLEAVDLSGQDSIIEALTQYLSSDVEASKETVDKVIEAGKPIVANALLQIVSKEQPQADEANGTVESAIKPVWIEDGHAFRSKLEATSSVQPVRNVTDFEDTEPKL